MSGDRMELMPMSPRQSPAQFGTAAVQWACSRRGRIVLISAVLFVMLVGFTGARHQEAISNKYHAIASSYGLPSWRPYLPNSPSIVHTPFNAPSNTTLQLENGEIEHVPSKLHKTTPNFHLLMNSLDDSPEFCKTTLSAMLLRYPPPTVINLYQTFASVTDREKEQMKSTLDYLLNEKLVGDEDLVLLVDGRDTWFQLPSDVVIQQYKNVVDNANARLLKQYGRNSDGAQKYNQTIIFGATKACEEFDMGCKYVPQSTLPDDIYGKETGKKTALMPAKYLNSNMLIGPAKDLKTLFRAAVDKFESKHSQSETIHSVFSAIFGEQQLARDEAIGSKEGRKAESKGAKVLDWFGGAPERREENTETGQYEFSIGLDYTHTIFQPFVLNAPDELVPLVHDNSTDLSEYHHEGTPTPEFILPTALEHSAPPFWVPDLSRHNPSPNKKPAHIENLKYTKKLDKMKSRSTSWAEIKLVQNTYTGVVPAILHTKRATKSSNKKTQPRAQRPKTENNITWNSLWFVPYSRALLRSYFRRPQSPIGYHDSLVGGDRLWDQRGGRGGVWTEKEAIWLPWGEVDGVCGTLKQLKEIFHDGKGVWLHENEPDNEQKRLEAEKDLKDKIAEEEEKQREKEEKNRKAEEERKKKEDEEERKKQEQEKAKQGTAHGAQEDAEIRKQDQEKAKQGKQQAEELRQKFKSGGEDEEGQGDEDEEQEEEIEEDDQQGSSKTRRLRRRWIA